MRRFFRIFWAVFAGVSLLLCVAAVGVWVRSRTAGETLSGPAGSHYWICTVARGRVGMARCDPEHQEVRWLEEGGWHYTADDKSGWVFYLSPGEDGRWDARFPGFGYFAGLDPEPRLNLVVLHLAYPTALFALAPLAWSAGLARRRRRARRARAGLCKHCAYDLRASSNRCPECGAVSGSKKPDHG